MAERIKMMTAVDLSDYSAIVVSYGVWLARQLNAQLMLINVINKRDLDMVQRAMIGYEAFSFPTYLADQEQERESKMKELTASLETDGLDCRYVVRSGIPYQELLDAIEAERVQLVVVGTKGRSNLADVIVGSTARRLYQRSPVPLLSIPAGFDKIP
jgi:nucleotide-binding universal stress UspA family protein